MGSRSVGLVVDEVDVGDLRPDPFNPRRISDHEMEALTRSIQEFGLVDPIIARREDSTVIGGHQRLLAARRLGLKTAPVIFVDVSTEQARLLNLALNKIAGSWDQELLARLMVDLSASPNVDLSLSGFGEDEIEEGLWDHNRAILIGDDDVIWKDRDAPTADRFAPTDKRQPGD